MTRRHVAAGTVRGGLTTSDTMMPRQASASSATAMTCPVCPVSTSSWPGSGLTAADLMLARPRGNEMVFCTRAFGPRMATGPTIAANTARAVPDRIPAARLPSLTATSTTAISRAGHAVAFIAAATPNARPASNGCGSRQSSAMPRHRQASTGTSVPPTVSENAINGDAVTSTVQRTTSRAPTTVSAAANTITNPSPNQIRGSVSTEKPSRARGMPNSVISGR